MKKIVCIMLVIFFCFSLSGCWNSTEPSQLAIGTSFIYDAKEDGDYIVTMEMLVPVSTNKPSNKNKSSYIYQITGGSIPEVIRNSNIILDKKLYGGHNKARIFTERFARKDVSEIMDYFLRDHITNEKPYVVVIKNENPLLIYEAQLGLSNMVGTYIETIAKTNKRTSSESIFVSSKDFIRDYYTEGKQPVMGVVEIIPNDALLPSDEKPQNSDESKLYVMNFEGLAVFKNNKMVGYLDKFQTTSYNYVCGNIEYPYISIPVGSEFVTARIMKLKPKIQTRIDGNDKVFIDITIENEIEIVQNESPFDLTISKEIEKVEQSMNVFQEREIMEAITKVQKEYASDIFGFGEYFHIQNPKKWQEIKSHWDDRYFFSADINVSANTSVVLEGEIREKFGTRVR